MPKAISIDEFVKQQASAPAPAASSSAEPLSIEEFASAKSAQPTTTTAQAGEKKPGLLKQIGIGLTKLPVRAALNIGTAADLAFGDAETKARAMKIQDEGIDSPTYGKLRPIGMTGKGFVADVKDAIGGGVEAASYIPVARAPAVASQLLKGGVKQGIGTGIKRGALEGGVSGALMGAGTEMQNPDSSIQDVGVSAVKGAALGTVTGGVLGGAISGVPSIIAQRAASRQKNITDTVGRVLQGDAKDIETGRKVLSEIDMRDVNTYREGAERVKEKVGIISRLQDEALETNPNTRVLDNLNLSTTVGGQTVKQNYVRQSLDELEKHFSDTNDIQGLTLVKQFRDRAEKIGVTVKQINDLARWHGKTLDAFTRGGDLSSALSKQTWENTRAGVKATARDLFGNNISKAADAELTKLIRVQKLFEDMAEKVNELQQRVQQRSLGEKVGRLLFQVADLASFGSLKGFVAAAVPRGQGLKTLNALDLEKQLSKNLRLIKKAADPATSEEGVIKALEEFIRNAGGKPSPVLLPLKASEPISPPFFATPKGQITPSAQESVEAAAMESGRIKPPQTQKAPKR